MIKKKIILIGAGQLGVLVSNILEKNKKYNICGFIDANKSKTNKKINNLKVLGNDNYLKQISPEKYYLAICIGDTIKRSKIINHLSKKGFKFPTIIDKNSSISKNTKIDQGTIVCGHSIILNDTRIGKFNIIGTGVKILHNVQINDNCIIGGGTIIGSNVQISNNVFFGVGAIVASKKILIKENSFICSGSVVLKNIDKKTKVLGNPAKVIPFK